MTSPGDVIWHERTSHLGSLPTLYCKFLVCLTFQESDGGDLSDIEEELLQAARAGDVYRIQKITEQHSSIDLNCKGRSFRSN